MYFNYLHCKAYQGVGQFSDDLIKKTSVKKRENHVFGRNFKTIGMVKIEVLQPVVFISERGALQNLIILNIPFSPAREILNLWQDFVGKDTTFYSGLNLNQDKATKPQTVQIVRQGEATPYWFKVNPLYKQNLHFKSICESHPL